MRQNVRLEQMHRLCALLLAIVMLISVLPLSAFAEFGSVLSTDIGEKEFVVGTATDFTFTTIANDDAGTMVKGSFVFSDPDAIETLEYRESKNGEWYEFYGDFGPATGFPMTDATSQFRVTFKKAGIYTVEAYMKTVEDGTVVCSTSAAVMVNGKSVLSTNIDEKAFVVGETTEFEFTTTANEDAGKLVLGSFVFSDDAAVEKLEYKESQTGIWYEFYGDFGPATGFPMTDATSQFRVTFKKAGTYTVLASMKEIATEDMLCYVSASVTVKCRSAISFENESIEIKYSDVNATNDSLVDNVLGAEYIYKSDDENVVKVNDYGVLTPIGIGETTITVTRKENADYMAASATYAVKVVAGVQGDLTWDKPIPESIKWNDPEGYSNTVSGGSGTGDVTYKSDKPEIADVDSQTGVVTLKTPGTVTITATKAGEALYGDQIASYTLVVIKADQLVAFDQSEYEMINGDNSFQSPTVAEQGQLFGTDVVYSIEKNEDGVVSAIDAATGVLTFTNKTGKLTVRATKPEDDKYNEATATYVLSIEDASLGENVFHTIVGEKIDSASEWYTSNVSIKATDGYLLSYYEEVEKAEWKNTLEDAVADDGTYNITFYVKHKESGKIYSAQTVTIKRDTIDPTAKIGHEKLTGWKKFLSIITLGLWEPADMDFTIASDDSTSGVVKVEYFVDEGTTKVMDEVALDAVVASKWKEYTGAIKVASDKIFVVYTKVTDAAGQHIYATTNGIVFDKTAVPENNILIDVVTNDSKGFYDEDVEINVQIDDAQPSSGINSVTYEVLSDGVQTQTGSLFQFGIDNPTYSQLIPSWNSADDDKNIIVDSELNDSDNVKVIITVVDNAGNQTTKEIPLKICINKPTIEITYVDDPTAVQTYDGVTYYNTNRIAKIVITGRTSVFTVSDAPTLVITETKGDTAQRITYEVVDWISAEGETPDDATHTYLIKFNGSANYEFSVDYTDIFGHTLNHNSNKFAVDREKPTATITIDEDTTWSKLLSTLTFGLWKNEKVTVKAVSNDATSPIKKFEMYRTDSTEIMTSVQLDALYADGKFSDYEAFTVAEDAKFIVYIRVEDYAGHYDYICSDGFVVDMTDSEIAITPENTDFYHNDVPLYNGDVGVRIDVIEKKDESYSGIKEVKYWVTCDDVITQEKVLYSFDYVMDEYVEEGQVVPTYSELLHEFNEVVTIEAAKNNSCNVVLYVSVTDNAGNEDTKSVKVDIDVTDPTIKVEYNNNSPYKGGYYPANRTATITIVERTGHFEAAKATAGIKIKAVDANGEPIVVNGAKLEVDSEGYLVDIAKLFGTIEWNTVEGAIPDEAIHTAKLPYNCDANYTFAINYIDRASNGNEGVNTDDQQTPSNFTIDKVDPTATITVASQTWNKLLDFLTFGLFSKESVKVSATSNDVTSPQFIECYKTNKTTILSVEELKAINTWNDITADPEFEISEDDRFVVYLKVTDYAGNYVYLNSDGYVIDKTDASITLTPDATDLTHNNVPLYNDDVNVLINVVEKKDEAYSGIKEVKYWVTCDGNVSQPEVILYSFNNATPKYEDLLHEFTKTVTIDAEKNNSCNVVLYVTVTDNAGNVKTESVAVDIDITAPTITVDFDNNTAYKVVDGKGYFPAGRTATVVITERTAHFDAAKATGSIKITAVDATGKTVIADCSALVSSWTTEGTGNAATHTATIDFTADANYEFTLSYEDLATNGCKYEEVKFVDGTVAPRYFAVDKTAPTGTVTAGELGTWDKLIETLTFGLWSRNTVDVTGTANDVTTPIESVSYYKTSDTIAKSIDELEAITNWSKFDGIKVHADEKFVVYVKIVDSAGNVTYISTNGIIADETSPLFENVKPEITICPMPINGIYNSDVSVAVSVVDPMMGDTEAYAGLKEIRYEILNLGEVTQQGILYSFDISDPTHSQLQQSWSKADAIVVDKNLNNSNDVKIVVYAVDNAENSNTAECIIKIDVTPAEIEVTYNNNDGDITFKDGTYFKSNRTAQIVVTERNFNPEYFKYLITNTDGYVPVISGWETKTGVKANGDDTTHTATILFDKDGDYQFNIESCLDLAMNQNNAPTTGVSLAPWSFTIDKTAPIVSVVYNNKNVRNGNYYNAQRIATITVTEHNFETESDRLKISLKATDNGTESKLPIVSGWTQSKDNKDVYVSTITYDTDALYVFDFDYTDKAGNAAVDIAEQTFYIDKTVPVLAIEKIVDESANNDKGNIGFVMTATDTNFDVFTPVLTAVVKNGDTFETKQIEIGEMTIIKNGKVFTVINVDADGIYRITCTLVDKAGNAYSEVILEKADGTKYVEKRADKDALVTFSVNRNGSTFEVDESTVDVVEQYYVQSVENDVVIIEINADPLKKHAVTLNGKTLEENKDYSVIEEGGIDTWMKYTYRVNRNLFDSEGEYKLVVSSKDKADNDSFSDIKEAAVEFVVDRTPPVVTISGIANDGRYQTDKQIVTIIPTDDGGELKTLVVNMVDGDGRVIKEVSNLEGEALIAKLESNGGMITFELAEGLYQNVQIICTDCASGAHESSNTHNTIVKNISVSSSALMIFWANKPLRWSVVGGIGAVLIVVSALIIYRKKKPETR